MIQRLMHRLVPAEIQPPSDPLKKVLTATGYFRFRTWLGAHGQKVPDIGLYRPLYSPWLGEAEFERLYQSIRRHTLVSRDRCYLLWRTLRQATRLDGGFVECGVFRGGTALLAALVLKDRAARGPLHLFDSFAGMPPTTAGVDRHRAGDFSTTSLEAVKKLLADFPNVVFHPGFIPGTFAGVDLPRIAWAHVDVDIYQSVKDCIAWIYPRLVPGGFMIFDDYGFPSCAGERRAVDEAFVALPESPICLPTGQCLVIKLGAGS
jgi:O-methyltransferase